MTIRPMNSIDDGYPIRKIRLGTVENNFYYFTGIRVRLPYFKPVKISTVYTLHSSSVYVLKASEVLLAVILWVIVKIKLRASSSFISELFESIQLFNILLFNIYMNNYILMLVFVKKNEQIPFLS